MPVTLGSPGVYIEEIPSGVRAITGVATSVTAFVGRTQRGPVNQPTTINSFGDFERQFGGLQEDYLLSYAVRDFYLNGGSQAIIVRVVHGNLATCAQLLLSTDLADPHVSTPLTLEAASEGTWGNSLRARIDHDGLDNVGDRFKPLTSADLFNLTVRDGSTGATERFLNVTCKMTSPRGLERVLANESTLLRVKGELPADRPVPNDAASDAAIDRAIDADANIALADKPQAKIDAKTKAAQVQPFSAADTSRSVGVAGAGLGADGGPLDSNDLTEGAGLENNKRGLYALDKADLFNLLCIPNDQRGGDTDKTVYQKAMVYCLKRRAMLIVDSPAAWSKIPETAAAKAVGGLAELGLTGEAARNAALFFPRIVQPDPRRDSQVDTFVPCGVVAGIMARTDATRGVWKAPAGLDASITGVQGLEVNLTDGENGMLNPLGINCLRFFPVGGRVIWGSRTLRGADQLADEWKYIPVRRTALFIEESLYRGTQWVVFEPNDEPLWAQIRLNLGAFMQTLFRQGALQGKSPREAYFVKCDRETTTQNDINLGIVNIVIGFAPLKPAEFVVIKIQQMAGQVAS